MKQDLFPEMTKKNDPNVKMIGEKLSLVFNKRNKKSVTLKNQDVITRKVDLSDRTAKKLLVIDAVELGATKTLLAKALNISRQSIHNYVESKRRFGVEGLLGGYNPNMGKNLAECRQQTQSKRIQGGKAVILAEERKAKRIEDLQKQMTIDFEFDEKKVSGDEQIFSTKHDWEFTRFAGVFPYLIILISNNQWLKLIMGYFGSCLSFDDGS